MRKTLWCLLLATACSSSGDSPTSDNEAPIVYPGVAYTGFGGTATFKVPLVTNLVGAVMWTVDDPSIADLVVTSPPPMSPVPDGAWAIATTRKAGTTRVVARVGDEVGEAMLVVSAYDPAQIAAGMVRYTTSSDGGAARRACALCHAKPDGADHSPTLTAYYADDAILSVITTGRYPDGRALDIAEHAWELNDTERAGIVAYLRTLPPRGF